MLSIARKRREAERKQKLEEEFSKADTNRNGKIKPEQMIKIFEANDVVGKFYWILEILCFWEAQDLIFVA